MTAIVAIISLLQTMTSYHLDNMDIYSQYAFFFGIVAPLGDHIHM